MLSLILFDFHGQNLKYQVGDIVTAPLLFPSDVVLLAPSAWEIQHTLK